MFLVHQKGFREHFYLPKGFRMEKKVEKHCPNILIFGVVSIESLHLNIFFQSVQKVRHFEKGHLDMSRHLDLD
jgi:hypothetical protein